LPWGIIFGVGDASQLQVFHPNEMPGVPFTL